MNQQYEAAWQLHQFLSERGISYAVIGGIAVQYWGRPRFTADVDVTILTETGNEKDIAKDILNTFEGRIPDALEFSLKHRVLLIHIPHLCDVDISFGLPGFEANVISQSVNFDLGDGRKINLCSAEDLIIYKSVANRPQDIMDIDGIIKRQGHNLNLRYLRRWLKEFSEILEIPEIKEQFETLWKKCKTKKQ